MTTPMRGRQATVARTRGRRAGRGRRGAALVVALATLVLLMALSVALHAVALRERRSARRATLAHVAGDAAEAALARWQVRLATDDSLLATIATDAVGSRRQLAQPASESSTLGTHANATESRVTLVTLAGGARLLVSEVRAGGAGVRAARRVSLLLVPDSTPPTSAVVDTSGAPASNVASPRWWLVPAPERPWAELP